MVVTRKISKLFISSKFYYYDPNKTDYRIYIQFCTVCSCYTYIHMYNSKLHSLVAMYIVYHNNPIKEPASSCLAKQVLLFLGILVAKFCERVLNPQVLVSRCLQYLFEIHSKGGREEGVLPMMAFKGRLSLKRGKPIRFSVT